MRVNNYCHLSGPPIFDCLRPSWRERRIIKQNNDKCHHYPPHAVHILGALWAYKNNRKERSVTMWKIIQGSRSHHKYTIGRMNELFRRKRALTPITYMNKRHKFKKTRWKYKKIKRPGKASQIPIKLE